MTPADLEFVAELVRRHAGVVIRADKAFFIETRLGPVARREKVPGVPALLEQLRRVPDPVLTRQVVEATLMQETSFFRDRTVFEQIGRTILPGLAAAAVARGDGRIRVLSAGCATGQEAYSIAMQATDLAAPAAVEIVAVDFGSYPLEKARTGLYTHFEVQRGLPIRRLLAHFDKIDENWRARADLRQMIQWVELNLLDDLTRLGTFDLVLCRNVLGSLTPQAHDRVVASLEAACRPDAVMVVGALETSTLSPAFSPVGPRGLWRRGTGLADTPAPAPTSAPARTQA
jgi:chemotaxis protein methyltransferase CheR